MKQPMVKHPIVVTNQWWPIHQPTNGWASNSDLQYQQMVSPINQPTNGEPFTHSDLLTNKWLTINLTNQGESESSHQNHPGFPSGL